MRKELKTTCDNCGKEIKVIRDSGHGNRVYIVHGLFCINVPGFFCARECFDEIISKIKEFDYIEKDESGKPVVYVDVVINETQLLDQMYDIIYEAEKNPLFPTLILQRLLAVDPENVKFLYGLSSLYVGLLSAENTPESWKPKLLERLKEVEEDLKKLSDTGYKRLQRLRAHFNV
jgi:hypothetical protein